MPNTMKAKLSLDLEPTFKPTALAHLGGGASSSGAGGDGDQTPRTPKTTRRHATYALLSMLLLILQGTVLSIVLRYSRIKKGRRYLPSVAVFVSESIKLAICLAVQLIAQPQNAPPSPSFASLTATNGRQTPQQQTQLVTLTKRLTMQFKQALPMALPAVMFAFQQVLLIAAATYLDAVTYQIFNQAFKLIPTALFARWLLGQELDQMQWASMPVLALGVILVTVNNGPVNEPPTNRKPVSQANWLIGMVSCCISGLSSAFAGVYFEKYVKGKHAPNLWVRNIQLSVFGVPFSAALAWGKDGEAILRHGWLQGFSASTWAVVALQVFGGLVTGMVVKYCDNVIKNFAIAVSVILTVLVAIPLFGQFPSVFFLVGVAMVLLSVFMYGKTFVIDFEWWFRVLGQRKRMLIVGFGGILVFGVLRYATLFDLIAMS
jgi:UDP-sugar transporter A1/2/3